MHAFSRTILVLGTILTAGVCLAQKPANPPKTQPRAIAAKPCCRVVLLTKSMAMATGEPVPGAEILIEQEPGDVPVARLMTDGTGAGNFSLPRAGNVKFTVKLGARQIGQLKKNAPQAQKARLVLRVIVGGKTTEHAAEVSLANPSQASSGPFSQSISNIEDN